LPEKLRDSTAHFDPHAQELAGGRTGMVHAHCLVALPGGREDVVDTQDRR
jgi:hypothetical protein